ncbi:unnamed protein product [Diabrotica balteata]|uniref:beta-N-acetylhexosaminidase n=1 Tax=Diabrotica balteata TaxID=107213 RepID=A0A9P0DX97_DIABA|nr:unnamed protein product [Diabrotica balteata]
MRKTRPQLRSVKIKYANTYIVLFIFVLVICIFYFSLKGSKSLKNEVEEVQSNEEIKEQFIKREKPISFKGHKVVHLDLKGAPPKIDFYKDLFPLLARFGATGVLIEYEDMFPYKDNLINVSATNAYTLQNIREINRLAKEHNLTVIPLIQTFGHLEFILKLKDYEMLREVSEYPQVICPTHQKTEQLLETMVQQMLAAHPDSQFIHIGADEVYYLGICERCTDTMIKHNLSKNLLFIAHIKNVIRIVKHFNPHITVLMWDDEFRSFTDADLANSNFNNNVEPVIWKYTKDVYDELGPSLWDSYQKVFKNVWIASAFKGATGSNEIVPYATHYLQNHRSWMSVVAEYSNQFNFKGIIITGWQRYDHFAVLCELLPVGIPTLAMSLRILLGFNDSPLSPPTEIAKLLKCEQPYALIGPVFGSPKCSFPGGEVLEHVIHFQQLRQEFESILEDSRMKGWMSDYNVAHCFTNINNVESVTTSLGRIRDDLNEIKSLLTSALSEVYDKYTVEEWIETYVKPLETHINLLWDAKKKLVAKSTWNRRPFNKDSCK